MYRKPNKFKTKLLIDGKGMKSLFDEAIKGILKDAYADGYKKGYEEAHKEFMQEQFEVKKHEEVVSKTYLKSEVFHCGNDAIDDLVRDPTFPEGKYYGEGAYLKWRLREVDQWIDEQP